MSGNSDQGPEDPVRPRGQRVQSVERALWMLEEIAKAGPDGVGMAELADRLGMSRSAVWATLQTLMSRGFVAETTGGYGRSYVLGMALARLGDQALSQMTIRDAAMPFLRRLSGATGLTSRVAILHESVVTVVGRHDAPGAVRFNLRFGQPELLHCSAVGKALLSALPERQVRELVEAQGLPRRTSRTITNIDDLLRHLGTVRSRGYAFDDEEDAEGIVCVGAPVYDHRGSAAAAISVTGLKQGIPGWRLDDVGSLVADHAQQISDKLGGVPPGTTADPSSPARGRE